MTQSKPTECVFLEKYSVAPAPSRDYYGIRIAGNSLSLFVWKISRFHSTFPVVHSELLDDFVINTSLQYEIGRLFGEDLLARVMAIAHGEKVYLPNLPANVLHHILAHLDLRDIPNVARACRKLGEVAKSNGLWEKLTVKYFIGILPLDQRKRAKNIGWKKFFRANLHKISIKRKPVVTEPRIKANSPPPSIKANSYSPSIKVSSPSNKVLARPAKSPLKSKVSNVKPGRQDMSPRPDKIPDNKLMKTDRKSEIHSNKSEAYVNLIDTKVSTSRSIIQSVKSETNYMKPGNFRKNQTTTGTVVNNVRLECKTLAMEIRRTVDEIRQTKSVTTPLNTVSERGRISDAEINMKRNNLDIINSGMKLNRSVVQVKSDIKPQTNSETKTSKTERTVMTHGTTCGMTDKTLNKSDRTLTNLIKTESKIRNSVRNPIITQRTLNSKPSITNNALNKTEIKLRMNQNEVTKPKMNLMKTFSTSCVTKSESSRPNTFNKIIKDDVNLISNCNMTLNKPENKFTRPSTVNKVSASKSVMNNKETQSNLIRPKSERHTIKNKSTLNMAIGQILPKSARKLTKPGSVLNKPDKMLISSDSKVKKVKKMSDQRRISLSVPYQKQ